MEMIDQDDSATAAGHAEMVEGKHTPGPWKAHFNVPTAVIEGHIIKAAHGAECPIASLWVGGGTKGKPTQLANACLIAAAPEMYEQLKIASLNLSSMIAANPGVSTFTPWLEAVDAVLAKVESA
jgi:hypothetical protein